MLKLQPQPAFDPVVSPWPLIAIGEVANGLGYTVDGALVSCESWFAVHIDFSSGSAVPTRGTGTFQLFDTTGSDALPGSLLTTAGATGFDIDCVVTSGGGRLAGLTGTGRSSVRFTSNPQQFPTTCERPQRRAAPSPPPWGFKQSGKAVARGQAPQAA